MTSLWQFFDIIKSQYAIFFGQNSIHLGQNIFEWIFYDGLTALDYCGNRVFTRRAEKSEINKKCAALEDAVLKPYATLVR